MNAISLWALFQGSSSRWRHKRILNSTPSTNTMEPIATNGRSASGEWSGVGWGEWVAGVVGGEGSQTCLSNSYYSTKQEKVHIKAVGEAGHISPQTPPTQHSTPQSGGNPKLELLSEEGRGFLTPHGAPSTFSSYTWGTIPWNTQLRKPTGLLPDSPAPMGSSFKAASRWSSCSLTLGGSSSYACLGASSEGNDFLWGEMIWHSFEGLRGSIQKQTGGRHVQLSSFRASSARKPEKPGHVHLQLPFYAWCPGFCYHHPGHASRLPGAGSQQSFY